MKKFSLKAIRVNLGLTQEEMAKELSISVRAYTDKENGKSKWYWDEILKICEIAELSPEQIK